jgi:putative acetyltransferase
MNRIVTVRKITPEDNLVIATIIRTVMPEFGAGGAGFAIHDEEVDNIANAFSQPQSAYFVCVVDGRVLGGGGVAPLAGGDPSICELKKMYILSEARGLGLGQQILTACLKAAVEFGYSDCYLETFNTMHLAMKLYEKNAFEKIPGPLGNTGHFACDIFYKLNLKNFAG